MGKFRRKLFFGNLAVAGLTYASLRKRAVLPVFPLGAIQARHPDDLNSGIPPAFDALHPSKKRFKFEWWYFDANLDNGNKVVIVMQAPDLRTPLKRKDCVIMIYFSRPGNEAEKHFIKFPMKEFSASSETCDVRMGNNRIWGEYPEWHVDIKHENIAIKLDFKNIVPGWSRGNGSVLYGPDSLGHVLGWTVPQPRAQVSGLVKYNGSTWKAEGLGYHDHNWGSAPLFKYVTCWHWGRLVNEEITLIYADVMASRKMGRLTVPCLLISKNDRLLVEVGEGTKWRFETNDYVMDENGTQLYPRHVCFDFKERDVEGRVDLKVKSVWEIKETMAMLPLPASIKKIFAKLVAAPCYYRFVTEFALDLIIGGKHERHEGETITEYMILTMRRGKRPPDNYHLYNPQSVPRPHVISEEMKGNAK